jgi:hypothetical protein
MSSGFVPLFRAWVFIEGPSKNAQQLFVSDSETDPAAARSELLGWLESHGEVGSPISWNFGHGSTDARVVRCGITVTTVKPGDVFADERA